METRTIRSESKLIDILQEDIRDSEKPQIKIFAGHLPLIYSDGGAGKRAAELDIHRWGEFSPYTFDLGCKLTRYALDSGKAANILVVVDDLVEIPRDADNHRKVKHWIRSAQKRFYREEGLPTKYCRIAENYNVKNKILEQQRSFGSSKLISECKLKSKAIESRILSPNECSLAYNSLLNDPTFFDGNRDYLVSFMPGQCKGNICDGVLDVRDDIDASHIFFPHIETMGGILDTGAAFLKLGDGLSIGDIYKAGLITYAETESKFD